jgi:hypothetical protein
MVRRDGDGDGDGVRGRGRGMARRSVSWLLGTASSNLEVKAGCGWYMYSSTLGRRLGRTKNDRLVEVRSSCHYLEVCT